VKLCLCGCGSIVKNKFVKGHNTRVKEYTGGQFKKGRKESKDILEKRSNKLRGRKRPDVSERLLKNNPAKRLVVKEKISKKLKGRDCHWMKGDKNPMKDKQRSEKVAKKIKELWADSDYREKHSGINHHNYGKTGELSPLWKSEKGEYCPIFSSKEFREYFYKRDKKTCQLCGCTHQLSYKLFGYKNLTIHHINHIKQDCDPDNCILLCCSCNRKVEKEKYKKIYESLFKMKMYIEKGYKSCL